MTETGENWSLVRETVGDDRLSVIMPLYRLVASVETNLRLVADLFEKNGVRTELVPVDDGSADGTDRVLRRLESEFSGYAHVTFRPVVCPRNGGKGSALRAGFGASTGAYIMLLDGDLDIHPRQTPFFFAEMVSRQADIVVGSKRHARSVVQYPWHRRLVSACYFQLVKWFVGLPITDTQTGMKLFRRHVLGEALSRMLVKAYAFDLELLAIAANRGAKIAEAPVVIRFGQKFGALRPKTVFQMASDSLAVFYRLRVLRYYSKCLVPRELGRTPLVSVVIACPKVSWMLDECLVALRGQSYANWECLVLPDADEGRANDSRVTYLPTGKVRPAEKRNVGIAAARGEIVAFIDDDAYPEAHWLEYAVKYFGEPDIGAVGGPGVTPPGDSFLARAGGRVYDNLFVSGNYRYRYRAGGVRRDVDDYPSCNLFVRKSLLDAFGGYRTDFWPGEDTLLCKDIVDRGARIVYDPWVVVCHHRRALFAAHLRQLGRYAFHRGYFVKRYPSNSLHASYFAPSLLLAYVVALGVVAALGVAGLVSPRVVGACAVPLAAYLLLTALASFSVNPVMWLLTETGVVLSHLVYGVRFLCGLSARRAPCEYIGKDHAHG